MRRIGSIFAFITASLLLIGFVLMPMPLEGRVRMGIMIGTLFVCGAKWWRNKPL